MKNLYEQFNSFFDSAERRNGMSWATYKHKTVNESTTNKSTSIDSAKQKFLKAIGK